VYVKQKLAKYLVVGDSVLHNVGAEQEDMMVECFLGIKAEQLLRVIEKRELGSHKLLLFVWVLTT
jgi:hypothetical protein